MRRADRNQRTALVLLVVGVFPFSGALVQCLLGHSGVIPLVAGGAGALLLGAGYILNRRAAKRMASRGYR